MTADVIADVTLHAVAAALLHSLWQGALVAAATAMLWWTLRGSRPNARYVLGCAALALMVAAWTVTAWRTAERLIPDSPARLGLLAPPPALGRAGTFDDSTAIRTISRAELEDGRVPLAQQLESWSVLLVPLWLTGVFALSFRLALSWWLVTRLRSAAHAPAASLVVDRVGRVAGQLGVTRAVRVVQCTAVNVPAVIGWLRPVILLPASALTGLNLPQLDAILAHELAHVRRHDFAVNLLQSAAEILLFYHPACWWISRRVRAERELCCDDAAVSLCGDRILYATALAELEALRTEPALALGATDGPLLQRVRRLLAPSTDGPGRAGLAAALVPAALLALVMTAATLTAAPTPGATPQNEATRDRTVPAGHGVVRGQIVDARSGRPIAGAIYQITGPDGYDQGSAGDDGRFETKPIKTGTYTVSTRANGYVAGWYGQNDVPFGTPIDVRAGRVSSGIDIRMQAAGSINGRIVDAKGKGLQGVEIVLESVSAARIGGRRPDAAFAQTIEDGVYHVTAAPGDYYVRAYVGEALVARKGEPPAIYVSTFYPGVRAREEGQPLHVDGGFDLHDIDFTLASASLLRIRGRVVDPSGDRLTGISVRANHMSAGPGGRAASASLDAEGRFELRDLAPGEYMVDVWDQRRTARWVGAMKHLRLDADVDDLEMVASTGAHVVGRVVRDQSSTRDIDFSEVRFGFEKRLTDNGFQTAGGAKVASDGTFETETPGGLVTITVDPPNGWTVKSIFLDRVDVDGQTVDMSGGSRQLQVVLADHASSVTGLVVDRNGRTLPGYSVVLFADDERRWTPNSRFVIAGQSSQAGQFRLKDVPPGDYLAVAVPNLPFRAWTNAEVLVRLQAIATKLTVNEGEQKTISIRASPTPENLP